MMKNNGVMTADKTIRINLTTSVLKYQISDEITLNEEEFLLLSKAFFAEIESEFL